MRASTLNVKPVKMGVPLRAHDVRDSGKFQQSKDAAKVVGLKSGVAAVKNEHVEYKKYKRAVS